jgi:hypothetical protein
MHSIMINALSWCNYMKLYWKTGFWYSDRKGLPFDSTVSRGLQTHRLTCWKNLLFQGSFEGSETLSLGSLDGRSRSSLERRREARGGNRWNNINTGATHGTGSILRHVILKGISTQLMSASVSTGQHCTCYVNIYVVPCLVIQHPIKILIDFTVPTFCCIFMVTGILL